MMSTISKIMTVVDQQIAILAKRSTKGALTDDEVDRLAILADTAVKLSKEIKVPKPRSRPRGYQVSDDKLVDLAREK